MRLASIPGVYLLMGVALVTQVVEGWRLLSLLEHCSSDLEPHSNKDVVDRLRKREKTLGLQEP